MTNISVTRALAQIKTLDARIAQAAHSNKFVGVAVNGINTETRAKVEESKALFSANLQSVRDMIAQRAKLKAAVVVSNSKTKVSIGGEEMTVAEAIERKTAIAHEQSLLSALLQQRQHAIVNANRINQDVSARLDRLLETAIGKDRKSTPEEVAGIADPFVKANEATVIDSIGIDEVIQKLQDSISAFTTEVDYALSEINAVTQITVE